MESLGMLIFPIFISGCKVPDKRISRIINSHKTIKKPIFLGIFPGEKIKTKRTTIKTGDIRYKMGQLTWPILSDGKILNNRIMNSRK